jgi:VIT1/CCC1 family predicted Fe2+/Mn2+ transporter
MSISSFTGLMSSYSPLADRSPSASEDEKDFGSQLRPDVEAGTHSRHDDSERRSSRFIDGRTVSDAIIGLSDGMTVPFALTAGLSALGDTKIVVFGGLAELIAGAISMGLGGYLGAKSEE